MRVSQNHVERGDAARILALEGQALHAGCGMAADCDLEVNKPVTGQSRQSGMTSKKTRGSQVQTERDIARGKVSDVTLVNLGGFCLSRSR
jgi:hypothetical protein